MQGLDEGKDPGAGGGGGSIGSAFKKGRAKIGKYLSGMKLDKNRGSGPNLGRDEGSGIGAGEEASKWRPKLASEGGKKI